LAWHSFDKEKTMTAINDMMKLGTLLAGLLALASANAITVPVQADSYVSGSAADRGKNFGSAGSLAVNASSKTYLLFDLSTNLPKTIGKNDILKATLTLYAGSLAAPGSFQVSPVKSSWQEGSISFQAPPAQGASVIANVPVLHGREFVTVDVTNLVLGWLQNPSSNYGIVLEQFANVPTLSAHFDSKENTQTSHPAYLDIVLVNTGAQGPIGPKGDTGATGSKGDTGANGKDGAPGKNGLSGKDGVNGKDGLAGKDGANGKDGLAGKDGANGKDGLAGKDGANGKDGAPGKNGAPGPIPAASCGGPGKVLQFDGQNFICASTATKTGTYGQSNADSAFGCAGAGWRDLLVTITDDFNNGRSYSISASNLRADYVWAGNGFTNSGKALPLGIQYANGRDVIQIRITAAGNLEGACKAGGQFYLLKQGVF
jgi:hypothetical protein